MANKMRSIAVIPARGGSKRIPRKNVRPFGGKPMIAWTIEAALESGLFERVLVSTDDEGIAEVGRRWGASAPFLRETANDDITPVSVATIHALQQTREKLGETYDCVCQLMANCPLRTADDIRGAMDAFAASGANFQLSYYEAPLVIPWWAARLDPAGKVQYLFPDAPFRRSQDLEKLYFPTGAIWIARCAELEASGSFYGPDYRSHVVPWRTAVDIDNDEDFDLAEAVCEHAAKKGAASI